MPSDEQKRGRSPAWVTRGRERARGSVGRGRERARRGADKLAPPGSKLYQLGVLFYRTVKDARDDRVIGVAAEIAFFTLLAVPPFLLVLAGLAGFVSEIAGASVSAELQSGLNDALGTFLSGDTMREVVNPLLEGMFEEGRPGIISIGAVLALWSASRMSKVLIEALNVAYDIDDWRPGWKRRLYAVVITVVALFVLAIFLPLLAAGPKLGDAIAGWANLPELFAEAWRVVYWPAVGIAGVALLATLYHAAPNWWTPWRRDLPGALLAVVVWILAAVALRIYLSVGASGTFGPLAAPIVLLFWLYVTGLAVLLGAELNAEIEKMWPSAESHPKETPEDEISGRREGPQAGMEKEDIEGTEPGRDASPAPTKEGET